MISSSRHSPTDLTSWARFEDRVRAWSGTKVHAKRIQKAKAAVLSFTSTPCYAGVSWGKDSVCLAHLVVTMVPRIPLVWVRVEPDFNPDCLLVRDAFLAAYPATRYDEIVVERAGEYVAHGTLHAGLRTAHARYGTRYLSGVRGAESSVRKRRVMGGLETKNTCAPIGHWGGNDVFAYLAARGLPVHPAYACTLNGLLDPERIRVGPLGGDRGSRPGDGWGRKEWEDRYYRRELTAIRAAGVRNVDGADGV